MSSKKSKKSSSSKKAKIKETNPFAIKEKSYVTKEIETSITLLDSPEEQLVLEALLFLSKYGDIQRNNLIYVYNRGLLPKLLALLDHNICIVRVSLRLLSQLLTIEAAHVELNQEKYDEAIMKICGFYIGHSDQNVKEFSITILAPYSTFGKAGILLKENNFIPALLKTIKDPETDTILNKSLETFNKFLEFEEVRKRLPQEKDFNFEVFIQQMERSEESFGLILRIFEKITYFAEDEFQKRLKDCHIVEHMFEIIGDPSKKDYVPTCLNIVFHCMNNENTNSYFVTSFEFLKFCQWAKTCPDEDMLVCAKIFLRLSKLDPIRQLLFDLYVEDVILSFLRSNDKPVLNAACEAISYMSKHKYCCERMLTPIVLKKLLEILQRTGDVEDPTNEVALSTLHYFCRRDSRTIHMIRTYSGLALVLKYLKIDNLSADSYRKVLEIVNMFVTNNQLQSLILSPDLYEVILKQTSSKFDEICMKSLEIMINCLNHKDFQNYFILNKGSQVVIDKLSSTRNEDLVRLLIIFIHNALMFDKLATDFVYKKILLVLKDIPDNIKHRNPLIKRTINLIYDLCLPIKFFETGKLELTDKINERFYVINGPWDQPFPFLEVLQLRRMSTFSTIYVIDDCIKTKSDVKAGDCLDLHNLSTGNIAELASLSSLNKKCTINYGILSHDPYLFKYTQLVDKLLMTVRDTEKKIKLLAQFVGQRLCGPEEKCSDSDKLHTFKFHVECIKHKLGTNMIPIGYLRLGFHCERALLFKALADHVYIPATFVRGKNKLYWNEVALLRTEKRKTALKMFVVDLMNNIGQLLPVGSRECNVYCDIE